MSRPTSEAAGSRGTSIRLRYLGAAGWEFTDGETVILLDPYLSRVRYRDKGFGCISIKVLPGLHSALSEKRYFD